jgi:hypothetical protein
MQHVYYWKIIIFDYKMFEKSYKMFEISHSVKFHKILSFFSLEICHTCVNVFLPAYTYPHILAWYGYGKIWNI